MTTRLYKGITLRNYESYRAIANDGMTLEEAEAIFKEYYDSLDFTEEFFVEEYQKLVTHAMQYAAVRADWACLEREERVEADRARTNTHNQFLNDVQRYASFQKRSGENCHWFEALGQGIEPENISVKRARIGDWACYIALFTSLNMR